MTSLRKIDGEIRGGAEHSELNYIQSYLIGLPEFPEIRSAVEKMGTAIYYRKGQELSLTETEALQKVLNGIGPADEEQLKSESAHFYQNFNRFRLEVEHALSVGKGLLIERDSRTSPERPRNPLNADPDLLALLELFDVAIGDLPEGFYGNVTDFRDFGGEELVVLYADSHDGANHLDFGRSVRDIWLPAGFDLLGAENLNRAEHFYELDFSQLDGRTRRVGEILPACSRPGRDEVLILESIVERVPYSYIGLECLYGQDIFTAGLETPELYEDSIIEGYLFQRPFRSGSYKYFEHMRKNTDLRSIAMVENLTRVMRGNNEDRRKFNQAVMMVGAGHVGRMVQELSNRGISYVVVIPQSANHAEQCDMTRSYDLDMGTGLACPKEE